MHSRLFFGEIMRIARFDNLLADSSKILFYKIGTFSFFLYIYEPTGPGYR